ncbi:DUF423 domain-containing protein [Porticoccaceae bacterium]|nr:DUF423 domain-containing protein [Porticoccaceae bacterium]MDB2566351.1 DUF423 domain-containing protein [Porticoccaceae bacterium]MDB2620738.1 DUF423 domain-containing protein [Porticoccaceae bacterium]MDB2669589.1 DUF423 domain-containing protein [Porticoccaceae bacterium]
MNKTLWLRLIAISGALSIMFGAFGAHGLEDRLSASYLDTFNIAVRYQFLHTLALLGIICLPDHLVKLRTLHWVSISFAAGVLLFSGSLYLLVLFDIPSLGVITPIGGAALILGWVLLLLSVRRN